MIQPILVALLSAAQLCFVFQQQPLQPTQEAELLQQGRTALSKGEYESALATFQQAAATLSREDLRLRARYYLGRAYYHLHRYEEAATTYSQLIESDPANAAAMYELGKVRIEQQEFAQAAQQYAQLKQLGQRLPEHAQTQADSSAKQPPASGNALVIEATTSKDTRSLADELAVYLADLFPPEEATRYQVPVTPLVPVAPVNAAAQGAKFLVIAAEPLEMGRNGVTRPTILSREKARYTEAARLNLVQGVVVLSVVFSVEGEIKNLRVVRGLPDGLTRKAVEAALKIRFNPATKDGISVSARGTLEYSFNLY